MEIVHFITVLCLAVSAWTPCAAAAPATFNIRNYGALGNGTAMDTEAIQKTIDAAAKAGGGLVLLPPGKYLSGSLNLKSHVTRMARNTA